MNENPLGLHILKSLNEILAFKNPNYNITGCHGRTIPSYILNKLHLELLIF